MNAIDSISHLISSWRRDNQCPIPLEQIRSWSGDVGVVIHVAVMIEPYLSKVCSGEKYIESRLTKVNMAPFERAKSGDIVLLKRSGGGVVAVAPIERVLFEQLRTPSSVLGLADEYADGLRYEPGYAEAKTAARFASLLWLGGVQQVADVPLAKRSRQTWVTFRPEDHVAAFKSTERLF